MVKNLFIKTKKYASLAMLCCASLFAHKSSGQASLPLIDDFSSSLTDWTIINGTTVNRWVIGSATGNTGNSLYISDSANGSRNFYNTSGPSTTIHAYRDFIVPAGSTQYRLSFDYKGMGETSWDNVNVFLTPKSYTPVLNSAVSGYTSITGNLYGISSWTTYTYTVNKPNNSNDTLRLIVSWKNDASGGTQPPAAFDNLNIAAVTCFSPTAVSISNVTTNTASINFTPPNIVPSNGYEYYLSTSSTAPNANTVATGSSAASPIALTNLTPNTTYYVWVRSNCGTEKSVWTSSTNFKTEYVEPITYVQGFTTTTTPAGWNLSVNSTWTISTHTNLGGNPGNIIYKNVYGTTVPYAFSLCNVGPLTATSVLSFDYRVNTWNTTTAAPAASGYTKVLISNNYGQTYTVLDSFQNGVSGWNNKTYNIGTTYNGQIVKIRIDAGINSGYDLDYGFDNFRIGEPVACANPGAFAASNVAFSTATLNWNAPAVAPANGYQIYQSTTNTAPTATTTPTYTTSSTTYNLTNLTPSTTYYYWVRANCGTATSDWIPLPSLTTQVLMTSPYAQPFANTSVPLGWTSNSWNIGSTRGVTGNPGNNIYKNLYSSNTDSFMMVFVGPILSRDSLTFDWKHTDYYTYTQAPPAGSGWFKVLISNDLGSTYTLIDSQAVLNNAIWNRKAYSLSNYVGDTIKVRIVARNLSSDYDLAFDNFNISGPPCSSLVNLGNDTTLCSGSSTTLNAGVTGATYLWSTNATTQTINVSTAGTYWVQVTQGTCVARDTIIISTAAAPTVNLGNDTSICNGNSIVLNAGNSGATYLWSTNATSQSITTSTAGTYWVQVTNNGCSSRDTMVLTTRPTPTVNLGRDTTLCSGSAITLNAGNAGSTYLWSNNATTQTITTSTAGAYWVQVTNNGCSSRDTIVISTAAAPTVNLGNDTTVCQGNAITFNAGNSGATYLWSNNATTQTITTSTAGTYWVQVTANGCSKRDTIVLSSIAAPTVNLGNDTAICQGQTLVLNAGNPGATYVWSTGATTQQFNVTTADNYWVRVTNNGCSRTDTIAVTVRQYPIVNLGNDTSICEGQSVVLNAANPGMTYLWNNNSTSQTLTVSTAGTYWVQVSNGNCASRDTLVLQTRALPIVNLGNDTTFCAGNTMVLDAGNTGATYLWNTNATTNTISAASSGNYWVAVTANNCTARDTVNVTVTPLPILNLGNDTALCNGMVHVLNAGNTGGSYLWNNAATTQTLSVSTSGTYWVEVTANNCVNRDSINLVFNPIPYVNLGNDTSVCYHTPLTLDAQNPGGQYIWSNNSTTQTISTNTTGRYYVTVTNSYNCSTADTINLRFTPGPDADSISVVPTSTGEFVFDIVGGGNISNYEWSFGDGDSALVRTVAHQFKANGTYDVCIKITNDCGDTTLCTQVVVTSLSVNNINLDDAINVYPNPANGYIYIENKMNVTIDSIDVYNVLGQRITRINSLENKTKIDLLQYAAGVYQIHINTNQGKVVKKFEKL